MSTDKVNTRPFPIRMSEGASHGTRRQGRPRHRRGLGIGKATAFRLAKERARVGALSDTKEEVDRTAREIQASGGEAISLFADVGDEAAMSRATDELVHRYGRLDIVIANADINGVQAPIDELKPEEWEQTLRTNLRGSFLTLHYAVPHLKKIGAPGSAPRRAKMKLVHGEERHNSGDKSLATESRNRRPTTHFHNR